MINGGLYMSWDRDQHRRLEMFPSMCLRIGQRSRVNGHTKAVHIADFGLEMAADTRILLPCGTDNADAVDFPAGEWRPSG